MSLKLPASTADRASGSRLTHCIAVQEEDSVSQATILQSQVERVRPIEVGTRL
jgi:hypothetical protein